MEAVLLGGRIQITLRCGLVLGSTRASGSYSQTDVALVGYAADAVSSALHFTPQKGQKVEAM